VTAPDSLDAECRWPALHDPHARALREAVRFVTSTHGDVLGVIASGSVVRGAGHASSDIDLYVVVRALERQRVQRFFEGVAVEIFINPVPAIRRYLQQEHAAGRPVTAHMIATGVVVLDRDPSVAALIEEARGWLNRQEPWPDREQTLARYLAATVYEDALDVVASDRAMAGLLLWRAVYEMLSYLCRRASSRVPPMKSLVAEVVRLDPELGAWVRAFEAAGTLEERLPLAERIADRTLGARGFFEWESPVEAVEP
jgi:predicted nucleotidyltransferase